MRWLVVVVLLAIALQSIPLACGLQLPTVFTSDKVSIRFPVLHSLRSSVTSDELLKDPQFRSNGQWIAESSQNGLKLSEFLNAVAPQLFTSTTSSKNAIRKGLIRLNGLKAKNGDSVLENDIVDSFIRSQQGVFCSDFERKAAGDPSEFDLCIVPVLWEDNHCAVVIKPQGMPVFRTKDSAIKPSDDFASNLKSPCLQTALPYSLLPIPADSDLQPLRRPQAVHRLDKGTGGLIIVAKTIPALVHLTAQFSNRTVIKKYKAVVAGKLTGDSDNSQSSEEELLSSHPATVVGGTITHQLSGQSAETEWSVEPGMHMRSPLYGWISTVDLSPHTGRTHQLRRHMDMLSHPIMGDPDYWFQDGGRLAPPTSSSEAGPGRGGSFIPPRLEGRGIFLWSVGISFDHPVTGQRIELSIPEPDSYAQLREHLRSPP